jgi:hypothetical protein
MEVKRHLITLTPALSLKERELNVALLLSHSITGLLCHAFVLVGLLSWFGGAGKRSGNRNAFAGNAEKSYHVPC